MNYQRIKPTSTRATKIIAGSAVFLVLLRLIVPHAFAAFFMDIFLPLWRVENFAVRVAAPESQIIFSSDSPLASSTIAELNQENTDLKNMLGRSVGTNNLVATVVSKPPFSAYDSLIIDAGFDQGVQIGDKVYALADPVVYSSVPDVSPSLSSSTITSLSSTSVAIATVTPVVSPPANKKNSSKQIVLIATSTIVSNTASSTETQIEIPIGEVAATYGETSVVTLYSSPGQTFPVEIGSYHIPATATAEGAGMFEAMIPSNSNVVTGDPVLIPSLQTGVFAAVVSIVSDPARPYSVVLFQSPVDPFSLYYVEIEKANEAK